MGMLVATVSFANANQPAENAQKPSSATSAHSTAGHSIGNASPAAKSPQAPAGRAAPNVLNFDADVIEGEKANPDLFIQLGTQQPSLESIMYGRKDFNEFQKYENRWRPIYREVNPPQVKSKARPNP
jgi:hypothetical protein